MDRSVWLERQKFNDLQAFSVMFQYFDHQLFLRQLAASQTMNSGEIIRSGTTTRWSDTTVWNGQLFLCEVPDALDATPAIQVSEVLDLLAKRLLANGSSPSRLLSATIYLPYKEDLAIFNQAWDAWLPPGCAPVRACIHAQLTNPLMRVEIQAIAATHLG